MLFSAERHSQRPCALSDTLRVPGAQSGPGALSGPGASSGSGQGRGSRGQCGQLPTCLHNLEAVGAPPTFDCQCRSFLFLFVFARELGALQKMMGQIRGVFSFG